MLQWMLFLFLAVLLLGGVYFAWRTWWATTQFTPEEEAYDERVASLNDRQANRLSDEQLTRPISSEDAWAIMVRRGRRSRSERRRRVSRRR
jgi:hypothetical protein